MSMTVGDVRAMHRLELRIKALEAVLGYLRLEAIHYRNTGVGVEFLNKAILEAERALLS